MNKPGSNIVAGHSDKDGNCCQICGYIFYVDGNLFFLKVCFNFARGNLSFFLKILRLQLDYCFFAGCPNRIDISLIVADKIAILVDKLPGTDADNFIVYVDSPTATG